MAMAASLRRKRFPIRPPEYTKGRTGPQLERFHNSRALSGTFKGGFFSMKKPLDDFGSGVGQL
jgi:hypothetical protein